MIRVPKDLVFKSQFRIDWYETEVKLRKRLTAMYTGLDDSSLNQMAIMSLRSLRIYVQRYGVNNLYWVKKGK